MKRMGVMDAAWLMVDGTDTPMHVGSLTIFSLPPDAPAGYLRDMVNAMREVQEFASPFNVKLASVRLRHLLPTWIEDRDIDLDYHLRHSALPSPGGERELGMLVSRLHSHPMDFHRPLWEMHVIEGLADQRFALYMKMHHALMDGVGGMRLLQRVLCDDPERRDQPPPWAVRPLMRKSAGGAEDATGPHGDVDGAALRRLLQQQKAAMPVVSRALGETLREMWQPSDPLRALPFYGPASVLNGRVSGQRRFSTQHYDLRRISAVSKAAHVSLNDVFLALCASALRRYLGERRELPEQTLTAGVPVSIRPADDDESANAISFIIVNLNTQMDDALERLQAIHASSQTAKAQLRKMPRSALTTYTMVFMAPFMAQLLSGMGGKFRSMFNVTISNVPGPTRPMYFNGARMEQMYPISLLSHGQALNITAISYAGQFNVGLTGCRDTLPSMQKLAVYMGEALDELEARLQVHAQTRERSQRRRRKAEVSAQ